MAKTRMLFVSDVHGSDKLFLKFVNAGPIYGASVLVIGGDIAGKEVIPLLERDGGYVATVQGTIRTARTNEELEAL